MEKNKLKELDQEIKALHRTQEKLEEEQRQVVRQIMEFEEDVQFLTNQYHHAYKQNSSSTLEIYYQDSLEDIDRMAYRLQERFDSQKDSLNKQIHLNEDQLEDSLNRRHQLLLDNEEERKLKEKGERNGN